MSPPATGFLAVAASVTLGMLWVSILFCVLRLMIGPSLSDRVVALELIGVLTVGWAAVYSILSGEVVLLRAAIVLALVSFLGTVAFAHYVEKRGAP